MGTWRDLGRGIVLEEVHRSTFDGPQIFWIVRIPPGAARIRVARAQPQADGSPGLEPVSAMASRSRAIVAVNGGYFSPRDKVPLGLVQAGGEIIAGPLYRRAAVALSPRIRFARPQVNPWVDLPSGESAEVDMYNLPAQGESLMVYTAVWGKRSRTPANGDTYEVSVTQSGIVIGAGSADLGIPPGGYVLAASGSKARWLRERVQRGDRLALHAGLDEYWGAVDEALGGGPMLVRDGTASIAEDERFRNDIMRGRAARTAIGHAPDGAVFLVSVANGDPSYSVGMSLNELAAELVNLGAESAMNLDGGSSATVWADGAVQGRPGRGERPVANAIVVVP
jgi:hypothetical protein